MTGGIQTKIFFKSKKNREVCPDLELRIDPAHHIHFYFVIFVESVVSDPAIIMCESHFRGNLTTIIMILRPAKPIT